MNYSEAKQAHQSLNFNKFNTDPLFLYLNQFMKSGNKELQAQFLRYLNFEPTSKKVNDRFKEVYEFVKNTNALKKVKQFVLEKRQIAIWFDEAQTQNQLQELSSIDLVQDEFSPTNSIDKQLFSKVQKANAFSDIAQIVSTMKNMLEKKIYWTYYNTQTTRIIEDIFNKHPKVMPTLVDIKGVDFFLNDIPVDLKITRIPSKFDENFVKNDLIKWLYENQSEQRFGAENRLFLILHDSRNPDNSDRLKTSHYQTIKEQINDYLTNYVPTNLQDISFVFAGKSYEVKSDLIFINI